MYIKHGDVMCSPKTLSFYTVERGQVIRPAQFINCNLYFATYAGTRRIDEGGFLCNSLLGSLPAGFKMSYTCIREQSKLLKGLVKVH